MTTTDADVQDDVFTLCAGFACRFSRPGSDLPDVVARHANASGLNPPGEDARVFLASLAGTSVELVLTVDGELRVIIPGAGIAAGEASLISQANAKYFMGSGNYCADDWLGFGVVIFDLSKEDDFQVVTDRAHLDALLDDILYLEDEVLLDFDDYAEIEQYALEAAIDDWLVDDVLEELAELHPDRSDFERSRVEAVVQQGLDDLDLPYWIDFDTVRVGDDDLKHFVRTIHPDDLTEQHSV